MKAEGAVTTVRGTCGLKPQMPFSIYSTMQTLKGFPYLIIPSKPYETAVGTESFLRKGRNRQNAVYRA